MSLPITIIFVCEHGAAKSIIAAAFFNKLAHEKGLDFIALPRGTIPDPGLSSNTIAGLQQDGLIPTETVPQKLSLQEIKAARRVIAFCELSAEYQYATKVERWEDVPPVSENYKLARDGIIAHLSNLLNSL